VELFVLGVQLGSKVFYLKLEILNLLIHCAILILGFTPFIRGVSGCVVCLGFFPDFPRCLGFASSFLVAFGHAQLLGRAVFHGVQLFPVFPGLTVSPLPVEVRHVTLLAALEAELALIVLVHFFLGNCRLPIGCV
jgi:hypothetical protein